MWTLGGPVGPSWEILDSWLVYFIYFWEILGCRNKLESKEKWF